VLHSLFFLLTVWHCKYSASNIDTATAGHYSSRYCCSVLSEQLSIWVGAALCSVFF